MLCATSAAFVPAYAQEADAPAPQTKAPQPPKVGEIAPDFELKAIDGTKVKLSEQTTKGPVVLIELRGFPGYQCPICTAQVGQLINKAQEFSKAKAQVILVYPGPAEGLKDRAGEFVRGKDMPANFYLLLDPDFAVTNKYGLRWDAQNETSYPSTFVLDNTRKVLFAKVSHSHGDRASTEEILAALPREAA
ncbi:peroxiredoxin family protein [bacterium]|nr:MAG: peroxiredoxin family protein [bacterium]